jgi:hypothetical protein
VVCDQRERRPGRRLLAVAVRTELPDRHKRQRRFGWFVPRRNLAGQGLTAGKTYTLTFWLSGNPDGPPATKSLDVSIGSVAGDNFTYTTGANTHSNMMYTLESLTFVAGSSNTLSFASQDTASPYGPDIGGVSIAGIPEASTWAMMLLGFAGLGYAGYRTTREPRTAV